MNSIPGKDLYAGFISASSFHFSHGQRGKLPSRVEKAAERARAPSRRHPPFARRLKKADGFEEEECIRHPAHRPDGGESEDVNGRGLTVFSGGVIPGS